MFLNNYFVLWKTKLSHIYKVSYIDDRTKW